MTVQQAISNIHAPKGMTSIISGVMSGDYSVLPHDKGVDADLAKAKEMVAQSKKQLDECKSDWSYWSILSDLEYWKAIENILQAAVLVGENNLPDIPKPDMEGLVVMDAISKVSKYGDAILSEAKKTSKV